VRVTSGRLTPFYHGRHRRLSHKTGAKVPPPLDGFVEMILTF
jgi:hypothetical protein